MKIDYTKSKVDGIMDLLKKIGALDNLDSNTTGAIRNELNQLAISAISDYRSNAIQLSYDMENELKQPHS